MVSLWHFIRRSRRGPGEMILLGAVQHRGGSVDPTTFARFPSQFIESHNYEPVCVNASLRQAGPLRPPPTSADHEPSRPVNKNRMDDEEFGSGRREGEQ